MDGDIADLVEKLPLSARPAVRNLYGLSPLPKQELVSLIEGYADSIADAAKNGRDMNIDLARSISRCCITLLEEHWDEGGDHQRRLIQAACLYYVWQDDGNSDLKSASGFDDDAALLNEVVKRLGRSDLAISI